MGADNLSSAAEALETALGILDGKVVGDEAIVRGLVFDALDCIGQIQDARGD